MTVHNSAYDLAQLQAIFRDGTIWNNKDVGNHDKLTEPVFGTIVLIR